MPPTAVEVTLTVTVQLVLDDKLAPDRETDEPPEVADTTPEGQVVEAAGVGAIFIPLTAAPEVPFAVK